MALQSPRSSQGSHDLPLENVQSESAQYTDSGTVSTTSYLTFAEFRQLDENPRKFRHYMVLLQKQESKLRKDGTLKALSKEALRGKKGKEILILPISLHGKCQNKHSINQCGHD